MYDSALLSSDPGQVVHTCSAPLKFNGAIEILSNLKKLIFKHSIFLFQ